MSVVAWLFGILGMGLIGVEPARGNACEEKGRAHGGGEKLIVSEEGLKEFERLMRQTRSRAVIVRHRGEVIAEWYWREAQADTSFEVWSVSKSFASTCIGLLIEDEKIESIDQPAAAFIPEWKGIDKGSLTIAHLLDQTSGLKESAGFLLERDQLAVALEAHLVKSPGEEHRYNNVGCNVLSAIIAQASGSDPEAYMRERLWEPLGMTETSWRRDRAGNVITYAGIQTTARDLAAFGQFLLDGGRHGEETLLSKAWIDAATKERTRLTIPGANLSNVAYGLLWWLDFEPEVVPPSYSALGMFGNNLTVIPELELVGVRLVGTDQQGMSLMFRTGEWVKALAGTVVKGS